MFPFRVVKSHVLNHGFIFLHRNSNGKNYLMFEV